MIVGDIMTTKLITVAPDDTLGHAANLLRQYQFHHLPVVHTVRFKSEQEGYLTFLHVHFLKGVLSSQEIDLVAQEEHTPSTEEPDGSWRERPVAGIMQPIAVSVTPTTSVASAALILLERNLTCVPVITYGQTVFPPSMTEGESLPVLVGILTRSDLLLALARIMGVDEPGMELMLPLAGNDVGPLATVLLLAMELHIQVHSVLLAPHREDAPRVVTVRLGTINPAPLLLRLQEKHIRYVFGTSEREEELRSPISSS